MPERLRVERGSCFCGRIALEARGEPFWINYDHDDDCRKAIGGPLTVWIGYRTDQLAFTKDRPRTFSRTPGVTRSFCERCGSSIGYADEGLPGECWLAIGFMDHPERFAPGVHAFWSMKLPWLKFADDLPRVDRYSRDRSPETGSPDRREPRNPTDR
jgi:hypothetical protein